MSSGPQDTALRLAAKRGVPLAYQSGRVVVLVLFVGTQRKDLVGRLVSCVCSSAAQARAVADRVVADLDVFGDTHRPEQVLEVSARYAEAAWRKACRRMGRQVGG